jgi:uncharacterized protein (DUF58 family)
LAARARWVAWAVKVGADVEYRLYAVSLRDGPRERATLSGGLEAVIGPRGGGAQARAFRRALADLRPDDVVLLDAERRPLGPAFPASPVVYAVKPVRVLTNGGETQALIVPVTAAGTTLAPLAAGAYRFEFTLDRARFRAQAPDDTSNYRAEALIVTDWA